MRRKIPPVQQRNDLKPRPISPKQMVQLVLLAFITVFVAWPVPVHPEAWYPPRAESIADRWAPPAWSVTPEFIAITDGFGAEDLAIDSEGRVYGGLHDGRILRFTPPQWSAEELTNTGGRPLGLHIDANDHLIIADAIKGLLRWNGTHTDVLTTTCGGTPLVFTDDLDVAASGAIWFSDASSKFPVTEWELDILESRPNGRLCRYVPQTGVTEEILSSLYFANGVAIDPEQRFVLVNETSRYRVRRYWLTGSRAGTHDIILDNLPGFPDGISAGENGIFWLPLASPRNAIIDLLAPWPFLRSMVVRLPSALHPAPERTLQIIGMDANGRVLHHFADVNSPGFTTATSVQQAGDWLYVGSLSSPNFARLAVP